MRISLDNKPSNAYSKAFLLFASLLIIGKFERVQSNCISMRDGFKCEANEASKDTEFKVNLSNNGVEDVRVDIFKRVGDCKKSNNRPQGPPPLDNLRPSQRYYESQTKSELDKDGQGTYDRDLVVPKGGKLSVGLDKGPAPFCSITVVRNCRNSANIRMDCSSLLKLN